MNLDWRDYIDAAVFAVVGTFLCCAASIAIVGVFATAAWLVLR